MLPFAEQKSSDNPNKVVSKFASCPIISYFLYSTAINLFLKEGIVNMWVLTCKTLSGPVRMASKICQTRLEAMSAVRKFKQFIVDKTDDGQYIAGSGSLHGVEYMWSIELATVG